MLGLQVLPLHQVPSLLHWPQYLVVLYLIDLVKEKYLYNNKDGITFAEKGEKTIKAMAVATGCENSEVAEFNYPDADTAFDVACDALKALL